MPSSVHDTMGGGQTFLRSEKFWRFWKFTPENDNPCPKIWLVFQRGFMVMMDSFSIRRDRYLPTLLLLTLLISALLDDNNDDSYFLMPYAIFSTAKEVWKDTIKGHLGRVTLLTILACCISYTPGPLLHLAILALTPMLIRSDLI